LHGAKDACRGKWKRFLKCGD